VTEDDCNDTLGNGEDVSESVDEILVEDNKYQPCFVQINANLRAFSTKNVLYQHTNLEGPYLSEHWELDLNITSFILTERCISRLGTKTKILNFHHLVNFMQPEPYTEWSAAISIDRRYYCMTVRV